MSEWETASLTEAGVSLHDCVHATPKPAEGTDYFYVAIPNIKEGRIDFEDARRISAEDFEEWTKKTKPQAGDIIVTRRGRVGDSAVVPENVACAIGQNLVILRSDGSQVDQSYLRWALRGPRYEQEVQKYLNVGAVFDSLNCRDIPKFEIPVPPIAEQQRIAHILGTLDDKIELNRRMNRTLEAIARAIFKSWFVDFDPVHAKAEGRAPFGMDPETAALFPDSFQKSSLGRIPKGWQVGTIEMIVRNIRDKVRPTPEKNSEKYIALDDMRQKSVCLDAWRSGEEVNSSIIRFRRGDVLFGSMRPYFHKVGLAPFDGITRTTTFVLRPVEPDMRLFSLFHLSSAPVIEFSTNASVGSTIPYVKWDALSGYQIPLPPRELLTAIERALEPIQRKMDLASRNSERLSEVRDGLLPRLLGGSVEVAK